MIDLIEQIEMIELIELMGLEPEWWHCRSKHWWLWWHLFQCLWGFVVSRNDWIEWIDWIECVEWFGLDRILWVVRLNGLK